ncbi:MAG TPA: hypothetical protein VKZ18_07845 [Polyangia bacterium]|nr:hypothetical protein [Polyangia bacterium]
MKRSFALGLGAAAALAMAGVGCSQNGSFRLSWSFFLTQTSPLLQSPAEACGQNGVDSILASGTDGTGDSVQIVALCSPGAFTGTAPDGTWTFSLQMLDATGHLIQTPSRLDASPPGPASVASDGPAAQFSFKLNPPSSCDTYIDDNRSGAVQTAAPGCLPPPDGGGQGGGDAGARPDAAAQPDGGSRPDAAPLPDGGAHGQGDAGAGPDGSATQDGSSQ